MSLRALAGVPAALCLLISTPALADSPGSWERRAAAWDRALSYDGDESVEPQLSNGRLEGGSLQAMFDDQLWSLPLLHTDVDAEISGALVDIQLTQTFSNPFDEPIEALYLFPLPESAAVDDMWMQVGDEFVVAEIHRKEEARQIYDEARGDGRAAALLQQWRPNTFSQDVANIPPGGRIDVSIHLVQPLKYRDAGFEWVFPTVVGPRFIPANGTRDPDEDGAAYSARMAGPVSEQPTGNSIEIFAWIDAGVPIRDVRSPSHDILFDQEDDETADVWLDAADRAPNKDFILRWTVAGDRPELALHAYRDPSLHDDGYLFATIQPPDPGLLEVEEIQPKEMVFVVDTSCSMSGFPLDTARDVMRHAIAGMHPEDSFTILRFSSETSSLSHRPLPNTETNRNHGQVFVDGFLGGGGTHMEPGVRAALDIPHDPNRLREIFIVTDAEIGNEREVLTLIEQRLGSARVHTLGIGSAPNRALIESIARVGRGTSDVIRPDEDAEAAVLAWYDRIRSPLLTEVEVDFEGVDVFDMVPDPLPDLYAGEPVIIAGRYPEGGRGTVVVRGQLRGETVEYTWPIDLPDVERSHAAVASMWARKVVAELEAFQLAGDEDGIVDDIIELCLEHRIMSRHTSFVAVSVGRMPGADGRPRPVQVPREIPDMVDHSAIFGQVVGPTWSPGGEPHGATGGSSGGSSGGSGFGSGLGKGGGGTGFGSGSGMGGGSGFYGSQYGSQYGSGGLGGRGGGVGGGGSGADLGSVSTRGRGAAGASVYARPGIAQDGHVGGDPSTSRDPIIRGSIDKVVIDAVIKRHTRAIRNEYEQGLLRDPTLEGKVTIHFVIGADGKVSMAEVKSSSLGDEEVEAAIVRRFLMMRFPTADTGGIVEVNYSFVFINQREDSAPAVTP